MKKPKHIVLMRAYADFALVVAGTLQLFDDFPEADRKLAYSFPAALRAVCRYIASAEGADRALFANRLLKMFNWIGPDSRKSRYLQLRQGCGSATLLRLAHLEVTEVDTSTGITLLDKFGILSWFTREDFVLLGEGVDFDDRLRELRRLNGRWTFEIVARVLDELRFSAGQGDLSYSLRSPSGGRKRPGNNAAGRPASNESHDAAHDSARSSPSQKRAKK